MIVEASAPHKVILTGEHAVVYGVPSIATSINFKTYVLIEPSENETFSIYSDGLGKHWNRDDPIPEGFEFISRILQIFQDYYLNRDLPSLSIELTSDVEPGCGLGTSASSAVAFTGGLAKALGLDLDKEQINTIAYEAEKVTHATPSGIDNTVITYGGFLTFSPNREEKITLLSNPPEVSWILLDSGQESLTINAVEKVQERYNQKEQMVKGIFKKIWKISEDAWYELKGKRRYSKIGELMTKNHHLLQQLGVSNENLDRLVDVALEAGSLGAKMTGAGLGGYVIALPPQNKEELVAKRIKKKVGTGVTRVKTFPTGLQVKVLDESDGNE
ncbi:MAG: mevalonate kinase [Candidatus Korarchaeota archaeon]|nr:mevalonate kinase [Candidatus Korarchaeota archaeon]NIU83304.1 mevalonate kinase [Candidatus Thorarchaeota archaeon]NIW13640.1 mevalonate kinase [Candidatus Thorarchaeota archaeon]NIW51743.1 mevalonate kinase [Candidatus Korarchaeota archaeon]